MDTTDHGTGLWDARAVAQYLGTSVSWVYRQAETGALPSVRIGGLVRFEPTRIAEYVARNRSTAA